MDIIKKVDTPRELNKLLRYIRKRIELYKMFLKQKGLEQEYLNYELKRLEKEQIKP